MQIKGIHHVSAMTANARLNVDFYTKVLGMRLIKKTVNQDDTSMYHLFYGDRVGNPGTELTFFEIPNAAANHNGNRSISEIQLRVPDDASIDFWIERLNAHDVVHSDVVDIVGRKTLPFQDPEGQRLAFVSDETNKGIKGGEPWEKSPISASQFIRGLGPVKLTVPKAEVTGMVLADILGFTKVGTRPAEQEGQPEIEIYSVGEGGTGAEVHLEERTDLPPERLGRGGVHHVAFRVEDKEELMEWVEKMKALRIPTSGFVERYYFKSLYFREPNGILFELATDGPGFATDEDEAHLGESLALPPFLEPKRQTIEATIKPLDTGGER
ncbi:ring-cleaving dioxygenase [Aureibacillus halotolerans]|uniref:Glyoxalase family protein n=1 Tax=Aureibacillus halotolerans TaxID=1508390 RepID=A0A4R6TZL5_9BACI|nr:ring-cleaving dioxygenase [Aureibacillus halotolerans]TDQ37435.1 glyoxalase family protein [Aureibacillus halotolerans]